MLDRLFTIGVYGFTEGKFYETLLMSGARSVVDVRQRRGVRGAEYAWANAKRLENGVAANGIAYVHLRALAPTTEMRQLQYQADTRAGQGKRDRTELSDPFRSAYRDKVLAAVELDMLIEQMGPAPALLCVERDAPACHRSLIAEEIAARLSIDAVDLTP